jgi:phosphate transport system substrate-binding protein
MNRQTMKCMFFFALVSVALFQQCGTKQKRTIRIYGSTTIELFMKKAVEEYGKKAHMSFSIDAVGSKNGIDSLILGKCDIAMSSTEILTEQTAVAREKGMTVPSRATLGGWLNMENTI